jgi:hypothetical protein
MAIRVLADVARDSENPGARVTACGMLLDRGWGKAPQNHTGSDGEGDIRVTIRHIIEGKGESFAPQSKPVPVTINARPVAGDDKPQIADVPGKRA